ncbi:Uncharacterised protein [Zhongshania aliphaticivorans]|uniref:Uncharacterized protein n=1 Tax=Zhongshania aliphaticivorans TaxID=1470434 RepID=A0A5S9NPW7_9GAMM|nr:DUF1302 family protein [Zhongshania aliphaticivorans]CAA0092495.1 Uncharacterised protein [Zhongshania aliphaticivorans]CAA0109787.1 Uncharacterised protein [Zhongshania aliphaticivorans]
MKLFHVSCRPLIVPFISLAMLSPLAIADDEGWFEDFNVSFNGFVRAEIAGSTSGEENPNNQGGNYYNNQSISRQAYLPPALNPVSGVGSLLGLGGAGAWGTTPLPFADTIRRGDYIKTTSNDFNYAVVRTEIEMNMQFNYEWRFIARLRGMFDPEIYDAFDAKDVADYQGGLDSGPHANPALYEGTPSYFDYLADQGGNPNPLEWTGKNYQVYFPTFLLEYASGDLSLRLGNQQIAWGQAIFFRVFDTPNGLDLRRHSLLDRGLEEFSDKRVPMLSLRATYQVSGNVLADAYVGRFQPSVFGNPNTPYNIIPTQFTVHDAYESGGYDDKISAGFRLKGDYGQWGWQASFVSRYATEGTFAWTKSGVNKPLTGLVGNVINTAYNVKLPANSVACPVYDPAICRLYDNSGEAMANTSFSVNPGGIYSAEEWFKYAAEARLDAIGGLNAAITEFDATPDVYASVGGNVGETAAQLNTFFLAAGGSMRGHIERTYHRENDFALGASYVNESDNNFLNQLIFNLEVQYTPERTFTNPTLSSQAIKEDEYTVALVVDKWHRFFKELPGTYIVFQALTKNRSDLVGRHLSGYGRVGLEDLASGDTTTVKNEKTGNASYIVFGFLQPTANKIFEIELATLIDLDGGVLFQPGLRWNPGKGLTVEAFYNHVDGSAWGDNPTTNMVSSLDFADELALRVTMQF